MQSKIPYTKQLEKISSYVQVKMRECQAIIRRPDARAQLKEEAEYEYGVLESILSFIERQTPKKPRVQFYDLEIDKEIICPYCGVLLFTARRYAKILSGPEHCHNCGQALEWTGV